MSNDPSPTSIIELRIPGQSPPSQRARRDASEAIDALRFAAARLLAHLTTLRSELERAPMPDADPERDPNAVSRVTILETALGWAEIGATGIRTALGTLRPARRAVERLQIEAASAEAALVMMGRELDWAPWGISDGRCGLLSELIGAATDAAREIRVGLEAIAGRLMARADQ